MARSTTGPQFDAEVASPGREEVVVQPAATYAHTFVSSRASFT